MKTILGIDPGYDRVGICILEKIDANENKIIFSECFETNRKQEINERIFEICKNLEKIILKYSPTELAIEKLFFTTNQKTVMGVSEARGAVIYLAHRLNLKVSEYTPLQIKIALTGYGKATKDQIYFMLKKILKIKDKNTKNLDDEYDAIAVAYTHSVSQK
jgi:crossover junction endodeoxyribonuclease RuvC